MTDYRELPQSTMALGRTLFECQTCFATVTERMLHSLWHEPGKAAAITCPRCGRTSYNPHDIREGYCGNCHDWTSSKKL